MVDGRLACPSHYYCSPKYMMVFYFCACTEMGKICGGSPVAPQHLPSINPDPQLMGREVFCFCQGHPWLRRAHSTHPEMGHFRQGDKSAQGTPQWGDFEWVPLQSSLQRGSMGVNLDPKIDPGDASQHLVFPVVSPNYWLWDVI